MSFDRLCSLGDGVMRSYLELVIITGTLIFNKNNFINMYLVNISEGKFKQNTLHPFPYISLGLGRVMTDFIPGRQLLLRAAVSIFCTSSTSHG